MERNSSHIKGHYKHLHGGMQVILYPFTHGQTLVRCYKYVHHFSVFPSLLPGCSCLDFSYENVSLVPCRLLMAP